MGVSVFNQPVDAYLGSNVTVDPTYVFSYIPVADQITFGGLGSSAGMSENTDDMAIIINFASEPLPALGFGASLGLVLAGSFKRTAVVSTLDNQRFLSRQPC